jgi:hypothetical protein
MNSDMKRRDMNVSRAAFKARIAAALTTGAVVSLVLVSEASARISANHNETVLALDGALPLQEGC